MKLHLPLRLRSALIAAVATFAGFSAAYGAVEFTPTYDPADSTATEDMVSLKISGSGIGELFNNDTINGAPAYNADTLLIFDITRSDSNCYFAGESTIANDIQIGAATEAEKNANQGLMLYNGNGSTVLKFTGSVTGYGTISQRHAGQDKSLIFTGDMTGFHGDFEMGTDVAATLKFGNGEAAAVATGADKGLAGTGTLSVNGNGTVIYNYTNGNSEAPIYVTNSITGAGTIEVQGGANMDFTGATFDGNAFKHNGSGTVTLHGGTLGAVSVMQYSVLNMADVTMSTLNAHDGTTNLTGNVHIISTNTSGGNAAVIGGSGSSATINVGNNTTGATTNVQVDGRFIGHFEKASEYGNLTTVNVYNNATLNVGEILQIARDGKGILNIETGGTVIAQRLDMGTNLNANWTGANKKATLNLNGGSLYLGEGGLTRQVATSDTVINLNGGTLGGTADWSTDATLTATLNGNVTVNTTRYDASAAKFVAGESIVIDLSTVTANEGSTLTVTGEGTLNLGNGSSLNGLVINGGYLGVNGADGHIGSISVSNLSSMTGDGRILIDLGDNATSDTIALSNITDQRIKLTLNGDTAGIYTVLTGLTGYDTANLDLHVAHGLTANTQITESGELQVVLTGTRLDLVWAGTADHSTWSTEENNLTWNAGSSAAAFYDATDAVIFNDTAENTNVTISGHVTPVSITFDNSEKDYTLTGGAILGEATLTKNGTGKVTISSELIEWSGSLALNAGSLELQLGGDHEVSIDGSVTGEGDLTVSGGGTLTLNQQNDFTGDLTIQGATLVIGANGVLQNGAFKSGTLGGDNMEGQRVIKVNEGGILEINGKTDNKYAITLNGGSLVNNVNIAGVGSKVNLPSVILASNSKLGGSQDFAILGPSYADTSVDLATHTLTKEGENTVRFVNTVFTAGTLDIQGGKVLLDGGNTNASNVDFTLGSNGELNVSSSAETTTIKSLNGTGGSVVLGSKTLSIGGGSFGGVISGNGSVTTTGDITLSGNNTFNGQLTISSGTLTMGNAGALGAHNSSRVISVGADGTLDINGNKDIDWYTVTLHGGSMVNTGTALGNNNLNFQTINVTADSYLGGSSNFGVVSRGWGKTSVNLNTHKLTKVGANTVLLFNSDFGVGTLAVEQGTLWIQQDADGSDADEVVVQVGVNGTFRIDDTEHTSATGLVINSLNDQLDSDGNSLGGGTVTLGDNTLTVSGGSFTGVINATAGGALAVANNGALTLTVDDDSHADTVNQINVGENATLTLDGNYAGQISGATGSLKVADGKTLTLSAANTVGTVNVGAGATLNLDTTSAGLQDGTDLTLAAGSVLTLNNNESNTLDITVNSTTEEKAVITGGLFGNDTVLEGTIIGNGELYITNSPGEGILYGNTLKIDSTITDATDGALKLVINKAPGRDGDGLYLGGENTYSGGTVIEEGKVTVTHSSGLGTGNVELWDGSLYLAAANALDGTKFQMSANASLNVEEANAVNGDLTISRGTVTVNAQSGINGNVTMTGGSLSLNADKAITGDFNFQTGSVYAKVANSADVLADNDNPVTIGENQVLYIDCAGALTKNLEVSGGAVYAQTSGGITSETVTVTSGTVHAHAENAIGGTNLVINGGTVYVDHVATNEAATAFVKNHITTENITINNGGVLELNAVDGISSTQTTINVNQGGLLKLNQPHVIAKDGATITIDGGTVDGSYTTTDADGNIQVVQSSMYRAMTLTEGTVKGIYNGDNFFDGSLKVALATENALTRESGSASKSAIIDNSDVSLSGISIGTGNKLILTNGSYTTMAYQKTVEVNVSDYSTAVFELTEGSTFSLGMMTADSLVLNISDDLLFDGTQTIDLFDFIGEGNKVDASSMGLTWNDIVTVVQNGQNMDHLWSEVTFLEETGELQFTAVVVPEPGTASLGLLGLAALLMRRRRHR